MRTTENLFPFLIAILITLVTILAYWLNGIKVLVGIGIVMEIFGFTLMLLGRTSIRIKDRELFDKIFEKYEKRTLPEIEGSPILERTSGGIWLILIGLSFQLIGLFLL